MHVARSPAADGAAAGPHQLVAAKCELCLLRKVMDHKRLLVRFAPKYGMNITLQDLKTFELTMMER